MLEAQKASIIDLEGKVSPIVLAGILGINVSLVYQNSQAGIIPSDFINYSYREVLQQYIRYYKKLEAVKLAKVETEKELKRSKIEETIRAKEGRSFDNGDFNAPSIHPLVAAKLKQDIRIGRVKEEQLLLRNSIERGEYISWREASDLFEPFLHAIKNNLVSIASDNPELQEQIDQNMESLYNLSIVICEKADMDSSNYVKRMLARDLDITEIEIDFTNEG